MKTCRRCCVEKLLEDFYGDKRTPDGLKGWCKDCWNAYQRERYASNAAVREKKNKNGRDWLKANPDRAAVIWRRSNLRQKYGISLEDYDAMLAAQGGRCAVCGTTDSGDRRFSTFSVDHDHVTGTVRGLLCSGCNRALGHVGDSPDRLMALAAYLMQQNHPEPIQIGDGAMAGLMAGGIGAVVWLIVSIPINTAMVPLQRGLAQRVMRDASNVAPELRAIFENASTSSVSSVGIATVFFFFVMLFVSTLFGMFGGILGALMFRKAPQSQPPVVPPPIPQ